MTIARAEPLAAKLGSGRILLGGHRGNADEFPENTLASFRSAIELGVDLIECDVHLTEDGALPVIHDHLLDRTSNGSGLVRDLTMAELKALDAGSWKDPQFKEERIPPWGRSSTWPAAGSGWRSGSRTYLFRIRASSGPWFDPANLAGLRTRW